MRLTQVKKKSYYCSYKKLFLLLHFLIREYFCRVFIFSSQLLLVVDNVNNLMTSVKLTCLSLLPISFFLNSTITLILFYFLLNYLFPRFFTLPCFTLVFFISTLFFFPFLLFNIL